MSLSLAVVDETPSGDVVRKTRLSLASETVLVREIIVERINREVARFNSRHANRVFQGLVQPTDAESRRDGYRLREERKLDAEKQCELALEGFESNAFFMLVDGRQVVSLDESVSLTGDSTVTFVKLVPLVGG